MYAPCVSRRYWVVLETSPGVISRVYGNTNSLESAKKRAKETAYAEDLDITILKEVGDVRPL